MNEFFKTEILDITRASSLGRTQTIQELWSGYGKIMRIELLGSSLDSVVIKQIQLSKSSTHPRGWDSDIGHQRKLKSYRVETVWYENYSTRSQARVPECLGVSRENEEVLIVLEDLDAAGYPVRKTSVAWGEICSCLEWLARFHASYLGETPNGLWEVGTYWHLDTRPAELEVLEDGRLKRSASLIDEKLNTCKFKTFVHGDAKLANFCFAEDGKVAGVDLQYVGGGCGMKDVVYFIGSCLNEEDCERLESKILDTYFKFLRSAFSELNEELESEWRSLYRVAWADFHRFLKGWNPNHWKINSYSERVTSEVINNL